ncbi:DUF748 domain-containing protein [Kordiimonas aquimaris]|uniref:DUF748 domain-containing protein n=1 Tax=Kordiimonas aquimaris TaxID=707591 RepID=UPI0021D36595|nr:hypothetical protein [Kordiimonas aquimaris]
MKKLFFGLLLIIIVVGGVVYTQLNSVIKVGVETAGPEALQVDVTVGSVNISPLTGEVQITDLLIGQPEGFGDGPMMKVGDFKMAVETSTLMNDHIIVDEIVIDQPLIDARMIGNQSNFEALQKRLETYSGGAEETVAGEALTLTIRSLAVKAPQIAVSKDGLLAVNENVTLADFNLSNLGTDEKGLSPREIARHVMDTLQPQIAKVLINAQMPDNIKDIANDARGKLEKGVGDILGKLRKKDKN